MLLSACPYSLRGAGTSAADHKPEPPLPLGFTKADKFGNIKFFGQVVGKLTYRAPNAAGRIECFAHPGFECTRLVDPDKVPTNSQVCEWLSLAEDGTRDPDPTSVRRARDAHLLQLDALVPTWG